MNKKKFTLELDTNTVIDSFFEDTILLGVVAPLPDFQFVWEVNRAMNFDFRIDISKEIQLLRKGRKYYFGIYDYNIPTTGLYHHVFNNKSDGDHLLSEFKHLDYLWLIKGDIMSESELNELMHTIRNVPKVQMVTILNQHKIKQRDLLLF
jgi:hypothetical protein